MARRQQITILVFTLLLLTALAAVRTQRPVQRDLLVQQTVTYRIDVNHADAETLCLLPKIGPSTARKIIAHRETAGPFGSAEELEAVSGIGPKIRETIEPWVEFL